MVYADYQFYTEQFYGKAIAEPDFPGLAMKASQYIDFATWSRAAKQPELEAVKLCCCALAEKYQLIESAEALAAHSLNVNKDGGGEISSESVGSWSRSYQSGGYSAQTAINAAREGRAPLLETVKMYLGATGMLDATGYRGCSR